MNKRLFSKIFSYVNMVLFDDNINFDLNVPKSIAKWMSLNHNIDNLSYNKNIQIKDCKIYTFRYKGQTCISDIMFDDDCSALLIILIPEQLSCFINEDIHKIIILIYNSILSFLHGHLSICKSLEMTRLFNRAKILLPIFTIHKKENISIRNLYDKLHKEIDEFTEIDDDIINDLQDEINLDILDYGLLMKYKSHV